MLVLCSIMLTATGLVGCTAEPEPEPEPVVLTATEAGALYLDAVCPVNDAWDQADIEIDRLRIAVDRGETDTSEFAAAMTSLAEAHEHAAEALQPEDSTWPSGTQDEIAAVKASLVADSEEARQVAELPAEDATVYAWQGAETAAATAQAAREVLNLPEDPVAACEQHAEVSSDH